jgi:hypothetical protein
MFSKILVKLIDQSIVPAILLLATRVVSIVMVSKYFDIDFSFNASGFSFTNQENYITVNSYSTFFMIVVLSVGLLYVLLKSYIFHESHITPPTTAKLFTLNIPILIQTSFDIYSQGAIWLSYSYLLTIVAGIMSFFGLLFAWVFYVALVLCVITSIFLIFDIENEIKIAKGKESEFDEQTY